MGGSVDWIRTDEHNVKVHFVLFVNFVVAEIFVYATVRQVRTHMGKDGDLVLNSVEWRGRKRKLVEIEDQKMVKRELTAIFF